MKNKIYKSEILNQEFDVIESADGTEIVVIDCTRCYGSGHFGQLGVCWRCMGKAKETRTMGTVKHWERQVKQVINETEEDEKNRDELIEAIREFGINEPEIAQMGEFLSSINVIYKEEFSKIKYNYGAEFVEGLRKYTLETWEAEVNSIIIDTRLANRVQLENGLQEITAKVEKVYTAETQWGYQRRLILDVNANTLFVNITKALEEVNEGDTITIELEVSMFETAKYGEEIEVSETNPNGHSFTGMGKAGRRKLINHIKA